MKKKTQAQPKPALAKKRILIIDDHPLFRHGISQMINGEPDLEVCGEADNAPLALEAVRRCKPDLVTIDVSLKGTNGIELVKSIRAEFPKLPVLMLSMHDETLYAVRALRAGAGGYVMKQEELGRVLTAIRDVLDGKLVVSESMSNRMIDYFVQGDEAAKNPTDILTDRELEVLHLIGRGHSVQEIATALHLSAKTIESHRAHIKEKFNFKSAREVARFASEFVAGEEG